MKKTLIALAFVSFSLINSLGVKANTILPESYDSSAQGYVTEKKQQKTPTCWAYAGTNAAESSLLANGLLNGQTSSTLDLSEYQLEYYTFHDYDSAGVNLWDSLGLDYVNNIFATSSTTDLGGNAGCIVSAYSAWIGPVIEDDATDETCLPGSFSKFTALDNSYAYSKDAAHLKGAYTFTSSEQSKIKENIVKFGACYYDYYAKGGCMTMYYDENHNKVETFFYNGDKHVSTHAVSIIGWDDNFDKDNFVDGTNGKPESDGAWLVKDSGTSTDRTVWISYENVSYSKFVFLDFESANDYEYNYQYDGLADYDVPIKNTDAECGQMANIFTAQHNDTVKATGFYTANEDTDYKVYIYKNCADTPTSGTLESITTGTEEYTGYHVVNLSEYVNVKKGEKYAVVVEIDDQTNGNPLTKTNGCNHYGAQPGKEGTSFYRFGTEDGWTDICKSTGGYCFRVKAFTDISTYHASLDTLSSTNATVTYDTNTTLKDGDSFTFSVTGKNGYSTGGLGVLVNGVKVTGNNGSYTVSNIDSDLVIKVLDTTNVFTVAYDTVDGKFSSTAKTSYNYGVGLLLPTNITKEGYTFLGWSENEDTDVYVTKVSASDYGNKTFYAKWKANSYTVKYNANNGSGTMNDQTMTYDTESILTSATFTRTGYNFTGWNTKADGSGTSYANEDTVSNLAATANGCVTLYAQWENHCYTVDFSSNGGNGTMTAVSMAYDIASNIPKNLFTRTGYTFSGWATSTSGDVKYTDGESVKNIVSGSSDSITLYAVWKANSYTVKFNGNGGTSYMDDQILTYDTTATLSTYILYKKGYSFTEWNTKADGSGATYANKMEIVNLTDVNGGTVELYAQWKASKYTAVLDANGGYIPNYGSQRSISYYYGTGTELPVACYNGYVFAGWLNKKTGAIINEIGPDVTTLGSTLYAQWKPASYLVTYEMDNGVINDGEVAYYEYGTEYTLPTDVTRNGYTFAGWYTTIDYDKYGKNAVTSITASDYGNKTYYAKWVVAEAETQATSTPTATPTVVPTVAPTIAPTVATTVKPTATANVTAVQTATPTPTVAPTATPTVAPTATPTVAPTVKPTATPKATAAVPKKGTSKTISNIKYTVTKSASSGGKVKVVSAKSTLKNVTIPATVKINGYTFKVTEIENDAFNGRTKLVTVKIGNNVTTIGCRAFKGCTNLKTVTMGNKLKSIGKNTFTNVRKCKVKVPKSKVIIYRKLFRKVKIKHNILLC